MIKVLGIKIVDRIKEAGFTQEILSRYAGVITTRLGFHEVTDSVCSREACMILHLRDERDESQKLKNEIEPLGGVIIRQMVFSGNEFSEFSEDSGLIEIIGILVPKDQELIRSVQRVLTSYGCYIRTRLGVNETMFGEPAGLIILELSGDQTQRRLLARDLSALSGVQVRSMVF